ncbi:hypothetical protein GCM10007907_41300 [Chitinimonas prasina]|uniref:Uncharacterized protein n=1 Tax=Chitinimonas prasina TaxID=1434937 RepID=A0ABQ5YPK6_9NEIS|nr:hypothetical protein [Chitinimonas prasina]GLR15340.1 hypothetical protein GCM10007907_41300 [Chitinimonas prasina]
MLTRLEMLSFHAAAMIIASIFLLPVSVAIFSFAQMFVYFLGYGYEYGFMLAGVIYFSLSTLATYVYARWTHSHLVQVWEKSDVHNPSILILLGHLAPIALAVALFNSNHQPAHIYVLVLKALFYLVPFVVWGGFFYWKGMATIMHQLSNTHRHLHHKQ